MRVAYILMTAVSTLFAYRVPVTAAVGSDVALTGVMSLGVLHLVGADQSVSNQSRFLRGINFNEGNKEERWWTFGQVVEKLMAKNFVEKMAKSQSFSALEKVDDLKQLKKYAAAADDYMISMFKFADDAKMSPRDMANTLKDVPQAGDVIAAKTVELYTKYLKGLGKLDEP
ncbi:RxLR effector protein [Phytophthora megakarya]|uniref:RxLR effector protein n=1 Tax=Phytophthora megakarya TaxID=4795 RepID=A0A225VPX2_9STRA|nr:RxLR effector protein [Phytophthora megakarya]